MFEILNLIRDNSRWLKEPRALLFFVPAAICTILAPTSYAIVTIPLLAIAGINVLRLVILLPHESARIQCAERELFNNNLDEAVKLLRKPLVASGWLYCFKTALILSRAYARSGQFRESYLQLLPLTDHLLLPIENREIQIAWARLFEAADNAPEAQRRLAAISHNECEAYLPCLRLKANVARALGNLEEARQLLQHGLDLNPRPSVRAALFNDLAAIEVIANRPVEQLNRLLAARQAFKQEPQAVLVESLHHNLAICLIRAGRSMEARAVLDEAWSAGDENNVHHVIEVLNNRLLAAREAGDAAWIKEVYDEFEQQLARFKNLTPRQRLALGISKLRMSRNDGIPLIVGQYTDLVDRLIDDVSKVRISVPSGDSIQALREILQDLKFELMSQVRFNSFSPDIPTLYRSLRHVATALLSYRPDVDVHLRELAPNLIGPVRAWRQHRVELDKAQLLLLDPVWAKQGQHSAKVAPDSMAELAHNTVGPDEELDTATSAVFTRLFLHLREDAEWLTEQWSIAVAVRGWLHICDEYVAYHDQLPPPIRAGWRRDRLPVAVYALDQANILMEKQTHYYNQVDNLIGVAFFGLLLRNDKLAASRWMHFVDNLHPAMDQYAGWLREWYSWVRAKLTMRESEA